MASIPDRPPVGAPDDSARFGSYTAWARSAIGQLMERSGQAISLFESSVPEPVELLQSTLQEAFGHGLTSRYTSAFVRGNPYVVRHLQERYGVEADAVLCTTGATNALSLIYRAYLRPGDRILVETPGFDLFAGLASTLGIQVDHFERSAPGFDIDPARVAAAMRPRTRLVVFADLHNPTGALADSRAIVEVAAHARNQGALVVVDEVYGDYAPSRVAAVTLGQNVLSVSSLTKIYGLSTLRCGWIVADPSILAPVRRLHDELEFGVSKLAHSVAALVLESPAAYDRYWQDSLLASRPVMEQQHAAWLREGLVSGSLPAQGCIYFPRLVGIDDTIAFAARLARDHDVLVAPGEYFGSPGHVRIGFGQAPASLREGLERMTAALRVHRK